MASEKGRAKRKETKWPRQDLMDVLQDHIDVRATEQPELPIRLCQRAPWVCCKTNQLQRITRRHITVCMVIDKKGHQRQHQHLHDQHQHHQDQHQQQHQANVLCLPCAFAQANVNTTPHPRPVASPERHTNSMYIYIMVGVHAQVSFGNHFTPPGSF